MSFLIVKMVEEGGIVIVPSFWYDDGFCHVPLSDQLMKAERRDMYSPRGPFVEVKVLSSHSKFFLLRH